jgi:hypothetical protein
VTEQTPSSDDQYNHLRVFAAMQKQITVERLKQAIAQLEADKRPVTIFTIKEISGLDYMAYYRNREAFLLFQEHSAHLRKKREQAQATRHSSSYKHTGDTQTTHTVRVSPRDPLLDYKRPRLIALLHEAWAERDRIAQSAKAEKAQLTQSYTTEYDQLHQRYSALLQEHMKCGLAIARLEAQVAEYLTYIEGLRSSLKREEHGPQF